MDNDYREILEYAFDISRFQNSNIPKPSTLDSCLKAAGEITGSRNGIFYC